MNIRILIPGLILAAVPFTAFTKSAPNHNSLRALSMGNAFVAVADDYNTIYYNPAGLNNLDKLGEYEDRPDLGYYRNNSFDGRISLQGVGPDILGIGTDFKNFYTGHSGTFDALAGTGDVSPEEAIAADEDLYNDMAFLDRISIPVGLGYEMALAMHNFGAAFWTQAEMKMLFDTGIAIPAAEIEYVDAAIEGQLQTAYEIDPQLSVGIGYRLLINSRIDNVPLSIEEITIILENPEDVMRINNLETQIDDAQNNLTDPKKWNHGFDLGGLYQYSREVRLGGSITNIFINGINGEKVTPNLTIGMVFSPRKWQRNTLHGRKINFAVDFADAINNDRNYKTFSHLNMGAELQQTWLGIPWLNLNLLETRVAGGFKGGYWTSGAGLSLAHYIHLQLATWANEDGYFTGHKPDRRWAGELSLGF